MHTAHFEIFLQRWIFPTADFDKKNFIKTEIDNSTAADYVLNFQKIMMDGSYETRADHFFSHFQIMLIQNTKKAKYKIFDKQRWP